MKSTIIRTNAGIETELELLDTNKTIRVYTDIFIKRKNETKQIHVGNLLYGGQLPQLALFCNENEIVFYRFIKQFESIYSYNEQTISLNRNLYQFFERFRIRLILTYFEDKAQMNVSALQQYTFESDLGIGKLRRAKIADTKTLNNSAQIDINKLAHLGSVFAETVADKTPICIKTRKRIENFNQGNLFD